MCAFSPSLGVSNATSYLPINTYMLLLTYKYIHAIGLWANSLTHITTEIQRNTKNPWAAREK